MVGFQRRYAPVVQKAVQIVKEFGDLLHAISGGLNEDPLVKGTEAQRICKE